jgi:hypothetical protein
MFSQAQAKSANAFPPNVFVCWVHLLRVDRSLYLSDDINEKGGHARTHARTHGMARVATDAFRAYIYGVDGMAPVRGRLRDMLSMTVTLETEDSGAGESLGWADRSPDAAATSGLLRAVPAYSAETNQPRLRAISCAIPALSDTGVRGTAHKHAQVRMRISVGIDGLVDDGTLTCANLFPGGTATVPGCVVHDLCAEEEEEEVPHHRSGDRGSRAHLRETSAGAPSPAHAHAHVHADADDAWTLCPYHAHIRLYSRAPPVPNEGTHWVPALSGILVLVRVREALAYDNPTGSPSQLPGPGMCSHCGVGGMRLCNTRRAAAPFETFTARKAPYVDNIMVARAMAGDVMRMKDVLWQSSEPGEPVDQIRFPPGFKRAVEAEYRTGGYTRLSEEYWVNLARACLLASVPEFAADTARRSSSPSWSRREGHGLPFGGHGRLRSPITTTTPYDPTVSDSDSDGDGDGDSYSEGAGAGAGESPPIALGFGDVGYLCARPAASGEDADWDIAPTLAAMSAHGVRLLAGAMATYLTDCGEYATDRMFTLSKGGVRQEISDNLMPYQAVSPPSGDCENSAEVIACCMRAMQEFTVSNGMVAPATTTMQCIVDALVGWDVAILCMTSRSEAMEKGGHKSKKVSSLSSSLESAGGYKAHIIAALLPRALPGTTVALQDLTATSFATCTEQEHGTAQVYSATTTTPLRVREAVGPASLLPRTRNRARTPLYLEGTCWARHCLPDSRPTSKDIAAEEVYGRTRMSRILDDRFTPAGGDAFDFYSKFIAAIVPGEGYENVVSSSGEYKLLCWRACAAEMSGERSYKGQALAHGVDARSFANEFDRTVRFVTVPLSSRNRSPAADEHLLASYVASLCPAPRSAIDPSPAERGDAATLLSAAHRWCSEWTEKINTRLRALVPPSEAGTCTGPPEGRSHWVVRRRRLDGITERHWNWMTSLSAAMMTESGGWRTESGGWTHDDAWTKTLLEVVLIAAAPTCGVVSITHAFRVTY